MKRVLLTSLILIPLYGCSTQPSTYNDTSTPGQRNIQATGQAATEAARSNRSTNGDIEVRSNIPLTHAGQQAVNESGYTVYNPDGTRNHRAELRLMYPHNNPNRSNSYASYGKDYFKQEADYEMKRKIRKKIDKWIEDIF
jgi:hypothetical protein